MDAQVKLKEVDISNDNGPKMAKIKNYWTKQQTTNITSLLKEYQDVFSKDNKYLKGLVQ